MHPVYESRRLRSKSIQKCKQILEGHLLINDFSEYSDITDKSAVESLVQQIRRDFPPIAGIMHGAMVLQDTPFSDMTLETMNKVLRPKVLGTIHLDELFQDTSLDFFIMFSSLASAAGNRGQANYSAANMFMAAKTNERRRKGLAASVLHIGAVLGVGYVMRELDETVLPTIYRAGFMWMEERGFHQCIGEAILAGLPGSTRNPEIVTGLRIVDASQEDGVPWLGNPRFSHCIQWGGEGELKQGFKGGSLPVKALLLEATTKEDVYQVIQGKKTA